LKRFLRAKKRVVADRYNSLALNKFSFHTYSLPFFDESKKKKNQKKSLFLPKIAQFSIKI